MGQFYPKRVFPVYNRKREQHHWILHIRISPATKFQLKLTIFIFWTKFDQKGFSGLKQKKSHHHWILQIGISLGAKFQLKLTFLNFWTKFAQKGYFRSKTENVNIPLEFCMHVWLLVQVPNFSLNWHFWIFERNLPKKGIFDLKQKNCTFVCVHGCYSLY